MLKLIAVITALVGGGGTTELEYNKKFNTQTACEEMAEAKKPAIVEYLNTLYGVEEDKDYTIEMKCLITGERSSSK